MKTSLVSIKAFTRNLVGCGPLLVVLLALAAPTALAHWPNTNATKWVQFPDSSYNGLDMWLSNSVTMADDFKCILTGPVTDIHLWTSWLNNVPDTNNTVFTLSIWSDVPATSGTFSKPGTRLWTQIFGPGKYQVKSWLTNVNETFWNPDPPPGMAIGPDTAIFQYNFYPTNPFVQTGSLSAPQTYWLCVSVTGTTMQVGWKTSTNQWSDAAVFCHMTGTNVNGDWKPIKSPYFGTNLDLSFALTTAVVTNPPPPVETNSVKYSQLPCLTSVGDTNCPNCICYELNAVTPNWLADDFLCTNAGPVTDIHLWGSWLNDQPDTNAWFTLSIFSDVPAGVAGSFSQPGIMLWSDTFGPGQYLAQQVRYPDAEGFLDPVQGLLGMDYVLWRYDFYITTNAAYPPFLQQGSPAAPTNYWLAVSAWSQLMTNFFGWKISTNHYGDAAVFSSTGPAGPWQIAYLPAGNSGNGGLPCDMAFVLTTSITQCPPPSITCTSVTVQCGSPVSPPFAWDNCCNTNLTPVMVWSNNIGGPCPWTNLLTWEATDCRGQTTLCTQVVTVVDSTPPVITCVSNKTVTCGGDGAFDWPTAWSVCCGTNVTITVASTVWSSFDPLILTRTWKATDCCGLVNYCSQSVTLGETNLVKYIQLPNLTNGMDVWASDQLVLADDFVCTNSGLVTDIHIWCSWLGDYVDTNMSIWLGIYDDVPATNGVPSQPGNLKWQQWFSPGQYIQGRYTTGLEQFYDPMDFYLPGADTNMFYYCFYPTNAFHQQGTVSQPQVYWLAVHGQTSGTGSQMFGWKTAALQQGDAATWNSWPVPATGGWAPIYDPSGTVPLDLAFKITTSTNQCLPPTLTCSNLTIQCGSQESPPSAWDNCCNTSLTPVLTGSVTNGACPWLIIETWQATDCRGQTNTCTRQVKVVDTTPPVITCASNKTVQCGTTWSFDRPMASDLCCGTNLNYWLVGSNLVLSGQCQTVWAGLWQVSDCCSNYSTICTQLVTVVDTTPPVITCASNITVQCGSTWSFTPPTAYDACCGTNVTITASSTSTNGTCPWVITRIWQATDCCSNFNTCTQTVTMVDSTPPGITCVPNKTVMAGLAWSFDLPTAYDACCGSNVTITVSSTLTNSPCPLTVTRTWTAMDCCSNSASCSQTVTVVNTNTPPPGINTVKYVQWPKIIGGYDVYDRAVIFLADDFPCTNTGPITDIHVWCSFLNDAFTNPPIWLGIWSDVPAVGTNISHPGLLLWQQTFTPTQYQSYFWSCGNEDFYMPTGAGFIYGPDSQVYYDIFYPTNAFVQQGSITNPVTYWLSVYCQDLSWFGWKTSTNSHQDAAVWATWPPGPTPTWTAMSDPFLGTPLNMAFKITTGATPPIITWIQVISPNVTIWWTSVPGRTYRLLTSSNVETPLASWTSLGADTLAISDITSTTVPIGGSRQFYRIQLLPGSP
jgi:hypothetical protein